MSVSQNVKTAEVRRSPRKFRAFFLFSVTENGRFPLIIRGKQPFHYKSHLQRDGTLAYQPSVTVSSNSLSFMPLAFRLPASIWHCCCSFTSITEGFIYSFLVIVMSSLTLLDDYLELRSSSFPLGRTRASSVLLSLNHDLFTVHNVETLCGLSHAATLQVVINIRHQTSDIRHRIHARRRVVVVEADERTCACTTAVILQTWE